MKEVLMHTSGKPEHDIGATLDAYFQQIDYTHFVKWLYQDVGEEELEDDLAPARPSDLTAKNWVTAAMKRRQLSDPNKWALTVKQLCDTLAFSIKLPEYSAIQKRNGRRRGVTMRDLNRNFVVPWNSGTGCGMSVLLNPARGRSASLMLSHAWGEDVAEFLTAMESYFRKQEGGMEGMSQVYVWFCVFANYQPADGFGPSIDQQLDMEPFKSVIISSEVKKENGGYGMVAVHTSKEDLYTRLWCVHEVDEAMYQKLEVVACMSDEYIEKVETKFMRYVRTACTDEECLDASAVYVNTVKASCGQEKDEAMLVKTISEKTGGFSRLDKEVAAFRLKILPEMLRMLSPDTIVRLEALTTLASTIAKLQLDA